MENNNACSVSNIILKIQNNHGIPNEQPTSICYFKVLNVLIL